MRIPANCNRRALTVVEVLVALMLVSVGLLGMAGSSVLALRTAHGAAAEQRAVQRASARLALLAAEGCTRASSGSLNDPAGEVREVWRVGAVHHGVATLEATVVWLSARGRRTLTMESALLC